jgi:hypothetical protein
MAEIMAGRRRGPAPANIYTVLVFMAFLLLLSAVIFVWLRSTAQFGTQNPFDLTSAASAGWLILH